MYQALREAGIQLDYQLHIPFKSCGLGSETAHAYPDFVITMHWGSLILECDETQHTHYPSSCDVRRDFDIAASIALGSGQKLVILRYNPDAFRVAGKTHTTSQKDRLAKLLQIITAMEEPEGLFTRLFLFYDRDTEDAPLPTIAKEWDPQARTVSRNVF